MITLLFIIIIIGLSYLYKGLIKKHDLSLFGVALVVSILSYLILPSTSPINEGFLSLSFFILVMFGSLFKKGSILFNLLMSLRREYSILGFIFLLPHALIYLVGTWGAYEWFGVVAFVLMIPLFYTSFYAVRKKMDGKTWKLLHKLSYIAYALIFIHLIVIGNPLNHWLYIALLISYLFLGFKNKWQLKGIVYAVVPLFIFGFLLGRASINEMDARIIESDDSSSDVSLSESTETIEAIDDTLDSEEEAIVSESETTESLESEEEYVYADGTYTGSANGYKNLQVALEVTVLNDEITEIEVLQTGSTSPRKGTDFVAAVYEVIDRILTSQTTDVDTVSGATKSSNGVINAVEEALDSALQ